MKQFELNIALGTYISTDGDAGNNTGFSYFRGDRGLALKGDSGNNIIFSKTLTGIKTIIFGIKKGADSKIFLDDAADKLEISSGDISGTGLTQCYINNVDTDTVGDGYKLVIAEFNAGIDFSTNIKIAPSSLIYLADKIVFYDELLSNSQRAVELNSFIHSTPMLTEKYLKYGSWTKPTILNEVGISASFNFINVSGVWVDTSGGGNNISISKAISTFSGSKLKAAETIGNIGNIRTIAIRLKPDSTTEKLMEGAANAKLIHINSSVLTYPEFDLAYIEGVIGTAMVANKWQTVVITSSTDVDFSACSLALNNTTAGNFEIEELRFYTDEKSSLWVANYHNQFANRVVLVDDLSYDPIGSDLPIGWRKSGGTFSVAEDSTGKYILCGANGNIIYPGIDLSSNVNNGFIKKLSGDLNSDEGKLISEATNISYANNKVTVAMTTGQKFRDIYITKGYKLRAVTPDNISVEPKFWLDGQDSSQFTLDGNYINNWACKGSLAADVFNTNNNATRPTYDSNTGRVTFIAANSTFLQSAAFGAALSQPNTIFIVYKITGDISEREYVFAGIGVNDETIYIRDDKFGAWALVAFYYGSSNANNNIHVIEFNGANSNYWINGIISPNSPANVGNKALGGVILGVSSGLTFHSDAEIMEVIGYNSKLPFAENYGIVLYLKDKWNIAI